MNDRSGILFRKSCSSSEVEFSPCDEALESEDAVCFAASLLTPEMFGKQTISVCCSSLIIARGALSGEAMSTSSSSALGSRTLRISGRQGAGLLVTFLFRLVPSPSDLRGPSVTEK